MSFGQPSFLRRILLLISVLLVAIFAATGYSMRANISRSATNSVEAEVVSSFRAYEALWRTNTENLQKVSNVISRMADVRAAFMTNDQATIRDTAGELWSRIGAGNAVFSVADGTGRIIANLGEKSPFSDGATLDFIRSMSQAFPRQQTGFFSQSGRLFQLVVTPVYVDGARSPELLDVLVTGFELDREFLHSLKSALGDSDLLFEVDGRVMASTLRSREEAERLAAGCSSARPASQGPKRVGAGGSEYMVLNQKLTSLSGGGAQLCLLRSLAASQQELSSLLRTTLWLWAAGLVAAIGCTYAVVRRMLRPVAVLDRAASEIAGGNYAVRVEEGRKDELGRLAATFNAMASSLENARAELIRHERLESVARLATFVVHDLRNPLASIYAGAEMLVDNDLPEKQVKRLAKNMYNASRGVMSILSDLLTAAKRERQEPVPCVLLELVTTAWSGLAELRQHREILFEHDIPPDLELVLDRGPMERVFHNLFENSIEAIAEHGVVCLSVEVTKDWVTLHLRDNGRGIDPELRTSLFQPFASKGRAGGMGLGLALSRQTVLSHGGDLWADFSARTGSHFLLRLPLLTGVTRQIA